LATVTITWHAVMDDRTCPICMALNGHTWTFVAGEDSFHNALIHPNYGVVWDVQMGSKAHGHTGNCRCHIEPQFDLSSLLERLTRIREQLESAVVAGKAEGDAFG
jgi:uncharacterized protein with gpF-like domain